MLFLPYRTFVYTSRAPLFMSRASAKNQIRRMWLGAEWLSTLNAWPIVFKLHLEVGSGEGACPSRVNK